MSSRTSSFRDRLDEYAANLELALGGSLSAAIPPQMFWDDVMDPHERYREIAIRVSAELEARGVRPELEVMLYGLVDHAVASTRILTAKLPCVDAGAIQAGMVELAILILAGTCAADGTRHARRSNGNRLRNLYLERMRPGIERDAR